MRELLERLFDAWQRRDAAAAAEHFDEAGVYVESGKPPIRGREAIEAHFRRFFEAGISWEFHVERTIVEGPRAAVAYRFEMTRRNGDVIERAGCAIVETQDGKVRLWREYQASPEEEA